MDSQLTCVKEKKKHTKKEMTVHVFKSYQPQADISINKHRKREVGDTLGDFIPQFRYGKAGGFVGN